jgi:peptidoglycan/xylan/chitin deacetylase (PgdA/CDA1 family)
VTLQRAFFGPKVVAITVDDGPSRSYTPRILETLRRYNATATFFVVGRQAEREPDLVRAEIAQGHQVGSHTWSHPRMDKLSKGAAAFQVAKGVEAVRSIIGTEPTLFRPPRGVMSAGAWQAVARLRLRVVLWDESLDHAADRSPRETADRVLARVLPGDIILLHDGLGHREKDVEALALVLQGLILRGFRVVPLEQLSL